MTRLLPIILALVLVVAPMSAYAHSGGTDANGCHSGSRPYHCHGGGGGGSLLTVLLAGGVLVGLIAWLWSSDSSTPTQDLEGAMTQWMEDDPDLAKCLREPVEVELDVLVSPGGEVKLDTISKASTTNKASLECIEAAVPRLGPLSKTKSWRHYSLAVEVGEDGDDE